MNDHEHIRAAVALVFSWVAMGAGWLHASHWLPAIDGLMHAAAVQWLPVLDLVLRVALSAIGIYAAYWSARYYRSNTRVPK